MPPFRWSNRSELAARLLAEGELSGEEIAGRVGLTRQAVDKWKTRRKFKARVEENVGLLRDAVRRSGIAVLERRVDALDDRWSRMRRVLDERAASPEMQGVPGGSTGLLVRTAFKEKQAGKNAADKQPRNSQRTDPAGT